jgi:hypothetical protein
MAAALANRIINQLYESKGLFQQLVLSLKSRLLRAKGQLFLEFLISFGIVLAAVVVLLPKIIEQVAIGTPLSISISFLVSLLVPKRFEKFLKSQILTHTWVWVTKFVNSFPNC